MDIQNRKNIGGIGNAYGGLEVGVINGKFYWSIEDCMGDHWEEIPESLYIELCKFESSSNK